MKFSSKNFRDACIENFDLYKRALTISAPILYGYLGNVEDLSTYQDSEEEIMKRMASTD